MWTCPKCHRQFARQQQQHSCFPPDLEKHFVNRDPAFRKAFDKIVSTCERWGNITIHPMKVGIMLKHQTTFASFVVTKTYLKVNFFLDRVENVFPVKGTRRQSKNRVFHAVPVTSPKEVDKQLLGWLKESFLLTQA